MSELHNEPLTFEKVWTMFQTMSQETDRKFQAMTQETREQMKETSRLFRETREQIKETDRAIGKLGNRFGELAEHLVQPGIVEKFNELGFFFHRDCKRVVYRDPITKNVIAEVDIFLPRR